MRHRAFVVTGVLLAGSVLAYAVARAAPPKPPRNGATNQYAAGDSRGAGCAKDPGCNGPVKDALAGDVPALDSTPVRIPASRFLMGSDIAEGAADERPRHTVRVGAFAIDRYEVTNVRYQACVAKGVCKPPTLASSHLRSSYFENPEYNDYPVIFVDWFMASTFCSFASGRLPTEAEWEL